jgi:transposase InsO family protein
VLIDRLSRHVWVFPQKKTRITANILKSLESVRKTDIKVKEKISDRGSQFTSNEWRFENQKLGTKVKLAATHYPQTDGINERCIQSLKQKVRLDPTRDSITSKIQQAAASLNSVESTTTTIAPKEMIEAYMRLIESGKTEEY